MATTKILKDTELVGGTDETEVYPVSTTQALFSQYIDSDTGKIMTRMKDNVPEKLEDRLKDHEDDAVQLHKEAEKLTITHTNNKSSAVFEITGNSLIMSLAGRATIDTYGDAASVTVDPDNLVDKLFTINLKSSTAKPEGSKSGSDWICTYTISNEDLTLHTYSTSYTATYNGVRKSDSKNVTVTLRKYFSYADSAPTDTSSLEALRVTGISDISTSTKYIFTVPAINDGEKHIYFAVPKPMYITNIIQPSVGPTAQFAFHGKGTVDRVINGVTYTYNLYESGTNAQSIDGLEDTRYPKELQIEIRYEQ